MPSAIACPLERLWAAGSWVPPVSSLYRLTDYQCKPKTNKRSAQYPRRDFHLQLQTLVGRQSQQTFFTYFVSQQLNVGFVHGSIALESR
eukprot:scaffold284078_cov28-Prasinocladus_malaysianus.AAC.1